LGGVFLPIKKGTTGSLSCVTFRIWGKSKKVF
jgi:hypothetical protein